MFLLAGAFAIVLTGMATEVSAAAPFEGRYVAQASADGKCPFTANLLFKVEGPILTGTVTNSAGAFPMNGLVNRDGSAVILVGDFWGKARFSMDKFEADYANTCGARHAEGLKLGGASSH